MSLIPVPSNTAEFGRESKKADYRSLLFAIAISFGLGGCSWTFTSDTTADASRLEILEDDIQTGSITPPNTAAQIKDLTEEDWRRAKSALSVALDPHGSTDRVLWDNPQTLAKGHFTSDGPPFVKNDEICRNFKALVVDQAESHNLHGTACRPSGGEWNITDIQNGAVKQTDDEKPATATKPVTPEKQKAVAENAG